MDERHRVDEVAEQDKGAADQSEPGESVVERVHAARHAARHNERRVFNDAPIVEIKLI